MHLTDVGINLKAGPISSDIGIFNLHWPKGTHWVVYINDTYFDSCGCSHPIKLSKFIRKQHENGEYSEFELQGFTNKKDSYCAAVCLIIIYLTKVVGIDFESAVLNYFYQRFSSHK